MNDTLLDKIVEAVLYEGYILYPYRPTCSKNRQRFTFGRIYPQCYSVSQQGAEPSEMRTECLVEAEQNTQTVLDVAVRFLQPLWRQVCKGGEAVLSTANGEPQRAKDTLFPSLKVVPDLVVKGKLYQTWQEAVERKVTLPPVSLNRTAPCRQTIPFSFYPSQVVEHLEDDDANIVGALVRRQEGVTGEIEITTEPVTNSASPCGSCLYKISVRVLNQTPVPAHELSDPDAVLMRTFASTHTILRVHGGQFVSLMGPAQENGRTAAICKNIGTWPVLIGDEAKGERHTMLSSPIILYDYPKIAPESAGDLFDGTEIDELLTLRIMTMTDEEKREMRNVDAHARRLLERTEALPQQDLLNLHGTLREVRSFDQQIFEATPQTDSLAVGGGRGVLDSIKRGDRVRIRPKARADVMDVVLAGKIGIVEAVEQDAERRIHLALVLEDDPGKDLGLMRQTGHRFFFGLDEVEPLGEPRATAMEST